MFYSPAMLSGWLQSDILYQHLGKIFPECTGGIVLLNDHITTLESQNLYIGDHAAALEAIVHKRPAGQAVILICSGLEQALRELALDDAVTLIAVNEELLGLYNRVHHHVHKYLAWESNIRQALFQNNSLQALLDSAYSGMQTTMMLMNAGYKLLAGCFAPDIQDPMADELKGNGYLSFEAVQYIARDIAASQKKDPCPAPDHTSYVASQSGQYTMVWPLEHNGNIIGRLIVVLRGRKPEPGYEDLCRVIVHYIQEYMLSSHSADYSANAEFGSLAADLIEFRLTDPEELEERLKQIHLSVKKYYHVLLISFPALGTNPDVVSASHRIGTHATTPTGTSIPWNYVISQLEQVFPFSNITVYQNDILLMVRKTSASPRIHFDSDALMKILNHYNGFAAIGNFSKFLTSLGPVYLQTRSTIRLALAMRQDPKQRIFYYEDYGMYQNIELAATAMKSAYGTSNIVYLCHPALINLLRYDRKNGSNLCDVLYAYLTHDRNAAETARALFLHRNTMLYKIGRIEEILGQSLDDTMLRSRLLYSYHVIEYVTRYRGEDILVLKRNQPESIDTPESESTKEGK